MTDGTNICPGNCGEQEGFGTCESSGECSCSLGWAGPDCSKATCCPVYVVIGAGVVVLLAIASCLSWKILKGHRVDCKQEPKRPSKSKSGRTSASESAADVPFQSASQQPQRISSERQLPTQQEGLRTSAWVEEPRRQSGTISQAPNNNQARTDADVPSFHSPKKDAHFTGWSRTGAPKLVRSQTDAGGITPAYSKTDTRRSECDIPGRSAPEPYGRRRSEPASRHNGGHQSPTSSTSPRPGIRLGTDESVATDSMQMTATDSLQVRAVHQKMRNMMDHPILVRRKTFKELLVEHHPDKNSSEHATEVFQAVNNARSWFLHEPEKEIQNG